MIKQVDDNTANLSYFCPTQIRHNRDPINHGGRLIHILSNCAAYGIQGQSPVIVQFQVVDVLIQGKIEQLITEEVVINNSPIWGTKTLISFCSLNGHYLILENGQQTEDNSNLYRILKTNSFARYNIHLKQFNMTTLRNLNCMPYTDQYTLSGIIGSDTVYGVFSGDNIYNNLKFIDLIFNADKDASVKKVNFFAINDYVMQVSYGEDNHYAAILNNPPRLSVDVGFINDDLFGLATVPYLLNVWQSYDGKLNQDAPPKDATVVTIKGNIVLRKPQLDINFAIKGTRKTESGTLDLEQLFAEPVGNLFGIKVEGNYPGVKVFDRKTNFGSLYMQNNDKLFTQYFGDDTHGISLTVSGGYGLFQLLSGNEILNTYTMAGIQSFHADRLNIDGVNQPQAVVIAQYGETRGKAIAVFAMGENFVSNIETRYATCDKIRIADGGNNVNFLGLCLSTDSQVLKIWTITLNGKSITIKEKKMDTFLEFTSVIDFDVTSILNSGTDIFFLTSAKENRMSISLMQIFYNSSSGWDKSQPVEVYQPFKKLGTDPDKSYILSAIAAHINDSSTNLQHNIVVSTYGTKLFAVDLVKDTAKGSKSKWVDINQYEKPAEFDGVDLKVTNDYIAFKADRAIEPKDTGIFIYKYGRKEEPYIFTTIDLSNTTQAGIRPPPEDVPPPSQLSHLPFTLFKHKDTDIDGNLVIKTVIAYGGSEPKHPLIYRALGNMKLSIRENITNDQLAGIFVTFYSYRDVQVSLK